MEAIAAEVTNHLSTKLELGDLQQPRVGDLQTADLAYMIHSKLRASKDKNIDEAVAELSTKIQELFQQNPHPLIKSIEIANRGFLNVTLNREAVFQRAFEMVSKAGLDYGKTDKMKGKKAVVEHTSTNPNSTIHIGNFRSTITGAFIAQMLRAVGYSVEEWFFVNDLGGQIGLTYLGFREVYADVKPEMKIDLWVGMIYAVCNTLNEFQKLGWKLSTAADAIQKNAEESILYSTVPTEKMESAKELVGIYRDLRLRVQSLVDTLVKKLDNINIQETSAQWNLRYEHADPEAVREFRRMVILVLSGQQETLDTFGVHHQRFCFESELGWEGSNQQVLNVLKETPYFVDRTQKNEKGVPEGGYLDLDRYLQDSGLPYGKKGYQKNYPRFYIIRADSSTLYSFRDIVFSIKKGDKVDLVLNVICSEQNLAQEKVQLALRLLYPSAAENQWHLSYDLVRLVGRRMSGRKGLYYTVDEVYQELKEGTLQLIKNRLAAAADKNKADEEEDVNEEGAQSSSSSSTSADSLDLDSPEVERITHEVASAAMKYTMLACKTHTELVFDVKKSTDPNEASAPFLLYNYARFCSVLDKFEKASQDPSNHDVEPLCELSAVDWSQLAGTAEWRLLMRYVLAFPGLVYSIACPTFPQRPALPNFPIHLLPEFLINFVRDFSSFYKASRIITPGNTPLTHARIWFVKILKQVLGNGLRLMLINPLERM